MYTMTKYLYYANVKGTTIETKTIGALVKQFNDIYGYPILTKNSTYNYFLRPHRMQRVLPNLEQFQLRRSPCATQSLPE